MSVFIKASAKIIEARRKIMGILAGNLNTPIPNIAIKLIEKIMVTVTVWLLLVNILF